jgi:ribosomal protein L12E/L44/L45/RPP1/RPP2
MRPRWANELDEIEIARLTVRADRHQLVRLLAALIPGGISRAITATIAAKALSRMRPATAVETARMQLAADLLADVRRLDEAIGQNKQRITTAMSARAAPSPRSTASEKDRRQSHKEALRAQTTGQRRRLPPADHRRETTRPAAVRRGPGGHPGNVSIVQRDRLTP